MVDRPYVLLSCSMSIDGYLGGPSTDRLVLSNAADLDRVDAVRAGCDAILVGANTVRLDNPRLAVRSPERRAGRQSRGEPPSPIKVTVTGGGDLDPGAQFFCQGQAAKLVYCATPAVADTRRRLHGVAAVVDAGNPVDLAGILRDLAGRGVHRLMVEGGGRTHSQFLAGELADELQVAVAPLLVGDSRAPRFAPDGDFPWPAERRARLAQVRQIGDVVLLRYALSDRFTESDRCVET
jgi:5-amino-6-(5-phosphoribosylamino)uracil reductase